MLFVRFRPQPEFAQRTHEFGVRLFGSATRGADRRISDISPCRKGEGLGNRLQAPGPLLPLEPLGFRE